MPSTLTVTLIGATGFIGRRIAACLVEAGHNVVGTLRPNSVRRSGLHPQMTVCECSLSPEDQGLRDALGSADAVIYAAGAVRGSSPEDFRPANVDGVAAVAGILEELPAPAPPLLLISSLAASEPRLSNYARSKRDGEKVLESRPTLAGTIFRPPAVYGPGDREMRPLFDWMRRGIAPRTGPPGQRLSLLHADDLARAALAWLGSDPTNLPLILTLHDGREGGYSFDEIVEAVAPGNRVRRIALPRDLLTPLAWLNVGLAKLTRQAPMLTPGKVRELRHPNWVCDNAAIIEALNWQPEITLEKGVEELYRIAFAEPAGQTHRVKSSPR